MSYFPVFIELKQELCLVVGGGHIATRKVKTLLSYEANVKVVAFHVCEEIKQCAKQYKTLRIEERSVREEDFVACTIVIAATDDKLLNKKIYTYCKQHHILVNSINGEEYCTFLFPSTIKRRDISIGITTSGKSPALAKEIRKKIEEILPESYGQLNDILGWARKKVISEVLDEKKRRNIFSHLTKIGMKQNKVWTREEVLEIIRRENNNND